MDMGYVVALGVLAALGGLALGFVLWARPLAGSRRALDEEARAHGAVRERLAAADARAARADGLDAELAAARSEREALAGQIAALKAASAERDRAHDEKIAALTAAGEALKAEFKSLAGDALKGQQTQFLEVARETIEAQRRAAVQEAELTREKSAAAVKALVQPMAETLERYERELKLVEHARAEGYSRLTTLLDQMGRGQADAVRATTRLETALRSSGKTAGRWGEEQCRNVLERAGLVEGVDFEVQSSVEAEAGRQRPDFVLNLPGGRRMVIDVKCSLDAFQSAAEAESEEDRSRALKAHAQAVRVHAQGLAGKGYEKSVNSAVDFVVMFVPGENFLAAALEHDRGLMNDFMDRRVVLAGPINLVAVARTVAAMRDQARLASEAAEIAKLGRDLYDSLRIMAGNLTTVQKALSQTVGGWNKLVSQLDSRVMLRARRFEALGATTGLEAIPEIAPIELTPLGPTAPELLAAPRPEAPG